MTAAIQTTFYDALDTETRIVVQQRTTEIKALMRRAASDIIEIGQKLIEVKARLGHDNWMPWLKTEFDWTDQTARNFMHVARAFDGQNQKIFDFAPSALYLLAAPSTPDSARDEAIERAGNGEAITHQAARGIVDSHKDSVHPFISDEDFDRQIREAEYQEDEPLTPYEEEIERRETARRQQIAVMTASSESNEWYTPAYIIDRAREALGGIDFDPASSITANTVVRAESYCTIAENGYAQPWYGRVWLNPPYGREEGEIGTNAMRWSRKLIAEYEAGNVTAAILLVKAALGYNWFEDLWCAWPTCLLRERVSFVRPDGDDGGQSKHATALLYFGPDVGAFRSAFRSIGRIVMPETNSG